MNVIGAHRKAAFVALKKSTESTGRSTSFIWSPDCSSRTSRKKGAHYRQIGPDKIFVNLAKLTIKLIAIIKAETRSCLQPVTANAKPRPFALIKNRDHPSLTMASIACSNLRLVEKNGYLAPSR
ncbi:hypothetical protein G6L97_00730 [Agrobacterium tumefaciens]|uniref:hypothetical protein n=1 Tax=Agrobacterium tumefaciens TaxID=358 RepID=UPI0015749763|nr:hypothetical protein [Agrobacterium tumefaciens]NSZ82931.1 hypothetical protein [Agrobacterium tumefaciens]WCA69164.1 hypothetical protein G6L97_00730 [Agrobacterium tumefaciens]